MRVLLQNTETKLYFIDANEWTDDPSKATDFEEVELAAQVYHTHDLAYAQIVLQPALLPRQATVLGETHKYAQAT